MDNFKEEIRNRLNKLSDDRRLEFAIDICKRLFPEYQQFSKINSWGQPELLLEGIHFCETCIDQQHVDTIRIGEIKNRIDKITPETENFGNFDGTYALNAANAVTETLEFIQDKRIDHIFSVSSYMTDTIDFKITELDGTLSEEDIQFHPLMIKEKNHQLATAK